MSSQTIDPKAVREFLFARAAEAAREGKPAADKAFTHAAELLLEEPAAVPTELRDAVSYAAQGAFNEFVPVVHA